MSADLINPGHYRATLRDGRVVEVADLLEAFLPSDQFVGWCRASAVKYLLRAGAKHGEGALVEYRKGAWFINRLVEHLIAIEAKPDGDDPEPPQWGKTTEAIERIIAELRHEWLKAVFKFPAMRSAHEGLAILEEELDELRREAIQCATMACRFCRDLLDDQA